MLLQLEVVRNLKNAYVVSRLLAHSFESLTNDRDSLLLFFVFIAFVSFSFSKLLSLSLHPTGTIDPNRFRETCKQLTTFFPFELDSA